MKVLITGICGFAGSTLARSFRERFADWQLSGLDNFCRPGSESYRTGLSRLGVSLRHCDLRNASDLEGLPEIDWIIDAAANPSVLAGSDGQRRGQWCPTVAIASCPLNKSVDSLPPPSQSPDSVFSTRRCLPPGSFHLLSRAIHRRSFSSLRSRPEPSDPCAI